MDRASASEAEGCGFDSRRAHHVLLALNPVTELKKMNVLTLSRIQFGATIAFHYIYPPLSIGLGVMLVLMEGAWLKTGNNLYHQMARFWTKVFALTFAIGVVEANLQSKD